jgi:hypothetical protein
MCLTRGVLSTVTSTHLYWSSLGSDPSTIAAFCVISAAGVSAKQREGADWSWRRAAVSVPRCRKLREAYTTHTHPSSCAAARLTVPPAAVLFSFSSTFSIHIRHITMVVDIPSHFTGYGAKTEADGKAFDLTKIECESSCPVMRAGGDHARLPPSLTAFLCQSFPPAASSAT